MKDYVVGVDLGGTNVKTGLVTRDGALVQHDTRPTQAEGGPEAVMTKMQEGVEAVLAAQGIGKEQLLTVGIGAPGPMNWQTGIVYSPPNLPGWENVPLAARMTERLGMPVYIDNDANVACYGEFWSGAAKDVQTMVLMTLGTGVGGGIVIDGKLLRGIDGTAAEIGHLQVQRDGRPHPFGFTGNLEAYASVTGLVRTAVEALEAGRASVLTEMAKGDPAAITGKMISDAMRQGDEVATWAIQETARWLGCATASLINLLNPEMVLFSGGMIAAGEVLFDTIRETAQKQSFAVPFKRAKIGPAALGENAGVIGAAGCALERYLAEHP